MIAIQTSVSFCTHENIKALAHALGKKYIFTQLKQNFVRIEAGEIKIFIKSKVSVKLKKLHYF